MAPAAVGYAASRSALLTAGSSCPVAYAPCGHIHHPRYVRNGHTAAGCPPRRMRRRAGGCIDRRRRCRDRWSTLGSTSIARSWSRRSTIQVSYTAVV